MSLKAKLGLGDILTRDEEELTIIEGSLSARSSENGAPGDGDASMKQASAAPGFCVECEDQPASRSCEQCLDDFCDVCYDSQHRKGTRQHHKYKSLSNTHSDYATLSGAPIKGHADKVAASVSQETVHSPSSNEQIDWTLTGTDVAQSVQKSEMVAGKWFVERAKYIPLRLSMQDRKYLRLLEAALNVSEYTDKIDILSYGNKTKRQVAQIKELCSIISGLVVAADYKTGQALFKDHDFAENAEFFESIFELGRRHKIMNPEKMRSTYGKLIYMLQDSQIPEVKDMLGFNLVGEISTVYSFLREYNGLSVLEDDLIVMATKEIISEGRHRNEIQREIKMKERAIETLSRKYSHPNLNADSIKHCLYSIGDNHAFLRVNRDPCDKMIDYLKKYFNPERIEPGFSLSIQMGREGARLSHDHSKQYNYVLQSLTLWREIMHDMFMLWMFAEGDLLNEDNMYWLRDTGQGLNRLQSAPKTSKMMHTILHRAQQRVGYWVGSSVIHMGDANVPNALMFIDKYTQIFRILLPIVNCMESIDSLESNSTGIASYFRQNFNGSENLKKTILCDFFRHAFDGSGADNFFSAGSCIDGRLTSAWNWCSQIEKKPFFHVFLLSGFVGFDGEWAN